MEKYLGTEFLQGQGLGNRLFCYITARSLAIDSGRVFATAGQEWLRADFLDLALGVRISEEEKGSYVRYDEAEERLYLPTSAHDMVHGIFTAGADPALAALAAGVQGDERGAASGCCGVSGVASAVTPAGGDTQGTSLLEAPRVLVYGNLQDRSYFDRHHEDIKNWLKVRPEYESDEYTRDNLCILNVRGGEYESKPELFLEKRYWTDAMKAMRAVRPDMEFMIVTDDEEHVRKFLPGIECHHFSPEKDYVTVKNARYLIISNSSFAFFPAYTSTTVRRVIAPKYWARHNVSTGYWASEQNIYDEFEYLDRDGRLYTPAQCREELALWRERWSAQAPLTVQLNGEKVTYQPGTRPWPADDPDVAAVARRNDRRRKIQKAVAKVERTLFHK